MTWFNTPNNETAGDQPEEEAEADLNNKQEDDDKVEDISSLVKELYGDLESTNPEKAKELVSNLKKT